MTEAFLSQSWHRVAGLTPRLRPNLEVQAHRYQGQLWYVVRDHATNRVHRFTAPAYALMGAMDGRRTMEEIWTGVAVALGESAPSQDDLIRLVSHLHQQDLLFSGAAPAPDEMMERLQKQRRAKRAKTFKNPMSIAIPLWNPDAFLTAMAKPLARVRWGFVGLAYLAVILPALLLVAVHWGELTDNLSDQVLAAQNLVVLALVYPVTKLLHELGHGLAAKLNGGHVRETGVMLLVFFPVPYVDASSSQAFQDKRQRALVAAAGMMVEVFLAAIALYLWLAVEPGLVRAVAFNVMLIAGVSTLIVNGNPLLRFDGYFILCDLVEMPNLAMRANRWWARLAETYLFGVRHRQSEPTTRGDRIWFTLYAPASYAYRMIVLFSLALFIASQYLFAGVVIALWAIILGVVAPIGKAIKHMASAPALAERRGRALTVTAGGVVLSLVALLAIPLPNHTVTEGALWLPEAARVRAGTDGFIAALVAPSGTDVAAGDLLVRLSEPLLETRVEVQRRRVAEVETRLAAERFGDQSRVELIRRELEGEMAALAQLEQRLSRLDVRAATAGRFVVPAPQDLPDRFVREGQEIGYVTPADGARVRVLVPQADIELVRHRLVDVEAKLADRMHESYHGKVVREVPAAQDRLPAAMFGPTGGGRFAIDPRDPDGLRTLERLFQFDIDLTPEPRDVGFGLRVFVRFNHRWESAATQIGRRIRQLFLSRFDA